MFCMHRKLCIPGYCLHLDFELQARFGLLHKHLISNSNSSGAKGIPSSTTIGSIEVVPSFSFQPWSVGDKAGGSGAENRPCKRDQVNKYFI